MRRSSRNILILVAIVLVLGLGAVAENVRERMQQATPFVGIDTSAVKHVALTCPQCSARRFERVQGAWQMTAPYAVAADAAIVGKVLSFAKLPARHRHAAHDFDADKIGLAPPKAELTLDNHTLALGDTDAINGWRYTRYADRVALLPDDLTPLLLAPAETFVDKHPFARLPAINQVRTRDTVWSAQTLSAAQQLKARTVTLAPDPPPEGEIIEIAHANGETTRFVLTDIEGQPALLRAEPHIAYVFEPGALDALRPH
jgi:hypothetical protein